jgi:hypothetical protein
MHCWKILKDQPRWIERRNHMSIVKPTTKNHKIATMSSPSSAPISNTTGDVDDGQPSQSAQERLAGKKKENKKLWQCSIMKAMKYLVAKKKEEDVEKDLNKEEVQKGLHVVGRKGQD